MSSESDPIENGIGFILIIGALLVLTSGVLAIDLREGIIGYWSADQYTGTTIISEFGVNGSVSNTSVLGGEGIIGEGLDFTTGNHHAILGTDYPDFEFVTLNTWIKFPATVKADSHPIFFERPSGSGALRFGIIMRRGGTGDTFTFWVHNPTLSTQVDLTEYVDEWVMATINFNSTSQTAKFYLNAEEVASINDIEVIETEGSYLYAGWRKASTQSYYDGLTDEIGLWNRTLTQEEITLLYNEGEGLPFYDFIIGKRQVNEITNFQVSHSAEWYYWDFGDGNTQNVTSTSVNHTYTEIGVYNVTLTVPGSNLTKEIQIFNPVTPDFIYSPLSPFVGGIINFNETTNYPEDQQPVEWFWDFGGGNNATTQNATHTYLIPGKYNVTLSITTNETTTSNHTKEITVSGIRILVFDEETTNELTEWDITITNSTSSITETNISLFTQNETTDFPLGDLQIFISKSGYVTRTFYGTFDSANFLLLNAYLIESGKGVFLTINVKDIETQTNQQGALISAQRNIGGNYITVQQGQTDSAGNYPSFYLSPFVTYKITVTQDECNPFETMITPSETTYTILITCDPEREPYIGIFSDFFYRITPMTPTITQTTKINYTYTDPRGGMNWVHCNLINSTGDIISTSNVTGSASGVVTNEYVFDNDTCNPNNKITLECQWFRNGQIQTTSRVFYPGCGGGIFSTKAILETAGYHDVNIAIFILMIGSLVGMGVNFKYGFGGGWITMIITAFPLVYLGINPVLYTIAVVLSILASLSKKPGGGF